MNQLSSAEAHRIRAQHVPTYRAACRTIELAGPVCPLDSYSSSVVRVVAIEDLVDRSIQS